MKFLRALFSSTSLSALRGTPSRYPQIGVLDTGAPKGFAVEKGTIASHTVSSPTRFFRVGEGRVRVPSEKGCDLPMYESDVRLS